MGKKKSKAPTGRAGAKQKAQKKGTPQRVPSGGPSRNFARHMLDEDEDPVRLFKGFSPGNRRNFTPLDPAVKLRHQAISFVSASNTPIDSDLEQPQPVDGPILVAAEDSDDEDDVAEDDEEEFDSAMQTNLVTETDIAISQNGVACMNLDSTADTKSYPNATHIQEDAEEEQATHSNAPLFFIDTMGDPSLASTPKAKGKQPMRREPSPARSDSSEEVVVFHGRSKPTIINDPPKSQADQPLTTSVTQQNRHHKTFNPQPNGWSNNSNGQRAPLMGWASKPARSEAEVNINAKWAPAPAGSWWKKGQPRPDLNPSPAEMKALQDAVPKESKVSFAEQPVAGEANAETTIASLQADWKAVIRDKRAAKQTPVRDVTANRIPLSSPKSNRHGKRGRKKDNRQLRGPIDEDEDLDEAAYDDYMANLAAQMDADDVEVNGDGGLRSMLSNFAGLSGPSLVVDGEEIGDDEVLNKDFIFEGSDDTSSDDSGPIGQDLDELSDDDDDANYSDMNSSELEDELEYTEREQWEDEEDLRQRRREAMTDEQIAHIFQKQQELGIDGDEIVIENGEYAAMMDDLDGAGDLAEARVGLADMADMTNLNFGNSSNKNGMRRRSNRREHSFPNASAFADTLDQYGDNGFDIMDFDRPSLRPTKKGRKGKLPPELEALSDDELRDQMANNWDGDRAKKSLKKAEREELRQQGLLGSAGKKGKADMSQKYPIGISRQQIHQELRDFMQNDGQSSLPLPPMNKIDRKDLHDIANALNLKSKSVGTGKNRFPVVYKTQNSIYDPQRFDKAMAASATGRLDRSTVLGRKLYKQSKKNGKFTKGGGAAGGDAAARVKHGEVVGAGAAEISQDSFGHRMMEKMGWSKGMALGREGEGRLNPVEQVMREGRAGLG